MTMPSKKNVNATAKTNSLVYRRGKNGLSRPCKEGKRSGGDIS